MAEEIDKVPGEIPEEQSEETENFVEVDGVKYQEDPENEGQPLKGEDGNLVPFEEKPEEEEKITLEKTHALARALQKGYTLTRQDLKLVRDNQEAIREILNELRKGKVEEGFDEEEPLTGKQLLEILNKRDTARTEKRTKEDREIHERIESQLDELRAQGVITTKKEEDELLKYAVEKKITNLVKAHERLQEVKKAKKEGIKVGAKGKVKVDAGKKIGTSKKTEIGEKEGVDYGGIRSKDMQEIAAED